MLLFAISLIFVLMSSYLIASILDTKKSILGLFYTFLTAFAQIILSFEFLSLFSLIKPLPILVVNALCLTASILIWLKHGKPCWSVNCRLFFKRVINSIRLDKTLFFLAAAYLFFIFTVLFLSAFLPVTNGDAISYHVARSLGWALQGNLTHINVADIRAICLPINSEILYTWLLVFTHKNAFFSYPSFIGYIFAMIALYKLLDFGGFCTRKKLWIIFILSSFASVLVQPSGTETDIIIAALVLGSLFMFWQSLKTNEKTPLYMASLAYAIAIGTKTTSLLMIPGIGIFMLFLCHKYKNFKNFAYFLGYGLINFLLFSSFNYILNFIHFGNFFGPDNFMVVSKNYYGIKGAISNFVKYIFMFFDFTGFKWSDYVGTQLDTIKTGILTLLQVNKIPDGLYTTHYYFQRTLIEPMMGAGILGFIVYLPCVLLGLVKPLFNLKSRKNQFIFAFTLLFIINLIAISAQLSFMNYSVRFIMSFMVVSAPILLYSCFSNKNPLKYITIFFAMFYLIFVSTNLWARPVIKIANLLSHGKSVSYIRYVASCMDFEKNPQFSNASCMLIGKIKNNYSTQNKILAFVNSGDSIFLIKLLEYQGYRIDLRRLESISENDFSKYNIIITTSEGQEATYISEYEKRKDDYKIENKRFVAHHKRAIPCMYKYNPNIPDSKAHSPYSTVCIINKDFSKKHNLRPVSSAGLIIPTQKKFVYYVIMENEEKPIIYKNK